MKQEYRTIGDTGERISNHSLFTFTEAISLQVSCDTQQEIDYFWEKLGTGVDPKAQQCGWLKDEFGLSW